MKTPKRIPRSSVLLGVGFDADDDVKRLTRGENFLLFGGSQETHSSMQEAVIKVTEQLKGRGKRLEDVSPAELREMFGEAGA